MCDAVAGKAASVRALTRHRRRSVLSASQSHNTFASPSTSWPTQANVAPDMGICVCKNV